ncbi:MAG: bacterial transcriptional activator domain-containing protein [Acidobacteriota bacterium]
MLPGRGSRTPHFKRLLGRIHALDGPVIQLWSWPGSGQQGVLDALVAGEEGNAQPLAVEDLASRESLDRVVSGARAGDSRWLVAPAMPTLPTGAIEVIASVLESGRRLVFAAPRKVREGPVTITRIAPEEFLLREEEIGDLWAAVVGREPGERLKWALQQATDGWYRPLMQVAEAFAHGETFEQGALGFAPIRAFLQHEVMAELPAELSRLCHRLSLTDDLEEGFWRGLLDDEELMDLRRLVDSWGLAVDRGRPRLPTLVRAWTRQQGRAEGDGDWQHRLGRREWQRQRPAEAAELFVAGAAGEDLEALVTESWPELVAVLPLDRLGAVLEGAGRLAAELEARVEGLRSGLAVKRELPQEAELAATLAVIDELLDAAAPAASGAASVPKPLEALERLAQILRLPVGVGLDVVATALISVLRDLRPVPRAADFLHGPLGHEVVGSLLEHLGELSLRRLIAERPGLARQLRRRADLPTDWRSFLARLPLREIRRERPAPGFTLQLLGEGRVERILPDGATRKVRWTLRRAFLVVALLATRPDFRATREEIEEALWPGQEKDIIRNNFHPTFSHLRRSLGKDLPVPPLLFEDGSYQLHPELYWEVDSQRFERLVGEARERLRDEQVGVAATVFEEAWSLYRGPFLSGRHEAWLLQSREALQASYLELLGGLGEAYLRLERLEEAIDVLRASLIQDPLQELVHLKLMRVFSRQGRRDLVRRQYDRLTSLLDRELGVQPMPETGAEYQRLMT